jgi:hypothetical protein
MVPFLKNHNFNKITVVLPKKFNDLSLLLVRDYNNSALKENSGLILRYMVFDMYRFWKHSLYAFFPGLPCLRKNGYEEGRRLPSGL